MRLHTAVVWCFIALLFLGTTNPSVSQPCTGLDWIHTARITGNGLGPHSVGRIMQRAQEDGTLGIELDNDITGRYDSFLAPAEKLLQIRAAADAAHKIGNHAFIYIAGLECITANAARSDHSMFKDHPDWVQRDINGKPAVFSGGASFWVDSGDEDVWISPYAKEWRSQYMERVRQIAATGIDGVYVDVAYWMWLYEGWENTWASFDDYTVAAFQERTGLNARTDFTPGDFNNPAFLKWVDFRIRTITEFFEEISANVKSVNPHCLVIPEVSPTVNDEVVRSGADVYELKNTSDVITHEFFINTNTGAKRTTFDWVTYLLGVQTLRAFDEEHATWLLSYSWDREPNTDSVDAMKLLSCTQLMNGANFWDAPGHWMAGSNDYPTRKAIFAWTKKHEGLLYCPRKPINPIGVYFSPETRNSFLNDYVRSYYGTLHLLLNNHLEYTIVTPRTLKDFAGRILVLPDARILGDDEVGALERFSARGGSLLLTGETGYYDSNRKTRKENRILPFLKGNTPGGGKYRFLPECPGRRYFETHDTLIIRNFREQLESFLPDFRPRYRIVASYDVSAQQTTGMNGDCIFITNLRGLKGYSSCVPTTEERITITFDSDKPHEVYFLPYLGEEVNLATRVENGGENGGTMKISCSLPPVQFGGIVVIRK